MNLYDFLPDGKTFGDLTTSEVIRTVCRFAIEEERHGRGINLFNLTRSYSVRRTSDIVIISLALNDMRTLGYIIPDPRQAISGSQWFVLTGTGRGYGITESNTE